ncbi:MAG: flippase-like domain-containing protein, partial [Candidatus Eremiobacteraeota bacterium]|nr:flippase-like domain-containing protein [Candidatus Eremiobacteraeota bacterium]
MPRWLTTVLLLLAVVGAMAYFLDLDKVMAIVAACRKQDLLLAVTCFLAGTCCYAWRWHFLLPDGTPWGPTFHAANIGHAGNILIPGRAGEPARIVALARVKACSPASATSSVLVEKFIEQPTRVAFFALAMLAGLPLDPHFLTAGLALILVLAVVFFGLLVFQSQALDRVPRWVARLPRLEEGRVRVYLHDMFAAAQAVATPGKALAAVALTLSTWSFFTLAAWLTGLALGQDSVGLA